MKTNHCIGLAALLLVLAGSSCTKDDGGNGGSNGGTPNEQIDSYLSQRYLWNDEYNQMTRNLNQSYVSDDDNLLTTTLMRMNSNTLDKKLYTSSDGGSYYALYSYVERKGSTRAVQAASRGVNHGIAKELKSDYGFARLGVVSFTGTDRAGLYVMAVYPGSAADKAGIKRGMIFSEVNGATIPANNYMPAYNLLAKPSGGANVTLRENSQGAVPIQLTVAAYYPNPVLHTEQISQGGHKVGYLVYNRFDAAYDDELLAAVGQFRSGQITDLILDLRYNGGGHVISSKMLSSCIAGTTVSSEIRVFQFYRYNQSRMADPAATGQQTGNAYDSGARLFYEIFIARDYYGVDLTQYALNQRGIYVLTSGSTASSSEALINGLRGIDIPVTLIGGKTNGKNVGMEVRRFDSGGSSFELAPITFQGYNAKQQTVTPTGMEVDYAVSEWNNGLTDFGRTEPLVAKALSLITGSLFPAAPVRGLVPMECIATPDDSQGPRGMLVLPAQEEE